MAVGCRGQESSHFILRKTWASHRVHTTHVSTLRAWLAAVLGHEGREGRAGEKRVCPAQVTLHSKDTQKL